MDKVLTVLEVVKGFPGVVRVGVSKPFDKVLRFVVIGALVKDGFHFVLIHSIKKNGRWPGWYIAICGKGGRSDVGFESRYVEDRVDN